ncbi:hypothetical protein CHCC20488_2694 [Bacillus paralicheniformis]|nr:hypothetical protein CHCC20497_3839 [Bacillus paralicheniformis]TWN45138.1 hypothetical protein CHCC14523_2797 [Bacillus paralicheniformis]TWN79250.1 hypothetical protein CHCC20492_1714 [Bacillus paralicheniformis]TWO02538.1 hypothetical protein CHCC20488_2694 [Bacillus paralicheniformis]
MNLLFNTREILIIQYINRLHKDVFFTKKTGEIDPPASYHFS